MRREPTGFMAEAFAFDWFSEYPIDAKAKIAADTIWRKMKIYEPAHVFMIRRRDEQYKELSKKKIDLNKEIRKKAMEVAWRDAIAAFPPWEYKRVANMSQAAKTDALKQERREKSIKNKRIKGQRLHKALKPVENSKLPHQIAFAMANLHRIPDVNNHRTWSITAKESPDVECWNMLMLAAQDPRRFQTDVTKSLFQIENSAVSHEREIQKRMMDRKIREEEHESLIKSKKELMMIEHRHKEDMERIKADAKLKAAGREPNMIESEFIHEEGIAEINKLIAQMEGKTSDDGEEETTD
ncbi:MAG: hypothetical protein E4G90_06640 [Gemmatimonadales bacterium]|nr:MAG: hypothetical protein E4G90_06640 [Gemmatimonadales bacterium]